MCHRAPDNVCCGLKQSWVNDLYTGRARLMMEPTPLLFTGLFGSTSALSSVVCVECRPPSLTQGQTALKEEVRLYSWGEQQCLHYLYISLNKAFISLLLEPLGSEQNQADVFSITESSLHPVYYLRSILVYFNLIQVPPSVFRGLDTKAVGCLAWLSLPDEDLSVWWVAVKARYCYPGTNALKRIRLMYVS